MAFNDNAVQDCLIGALPLSERQASECHSLPFSERIERMPFCFAKKTIAKITKLMTYKEAITEIEAILKSLREEQNSIDTLSERVARATELIALCREKLRKAESDVNKVLEE